MVLRFFSVGVLYDDSERADGAPGTAPTGQLWTNRGSHLGVIVDGRLVKNEAGASNAFYLETLMPERVKRVSGRFSFVGTSGDNSSVVVLCSRDGVRAAAGPYNNMVHVTCSPLGVNVEYYTAGVATTVDTFLHSTPLAIDGTVYEWAIRFEGNKVIVEMPDGTEQTSNDANLDKAGRFLQIEDFVFTGQDAEPRWERVIATT